MVRLLVVEDSRFERQIDEAMLNRLGFEYVLASDYDQAIAKYQIEPIDIVLLDILMEGKNGIEILKRLRELNPIVKIILVSSLGYEKIQELKNEYDADGFIVKPVEEKQLRTEIERVYAEIEQ